ncbi:DUF5047 domain-containing protein [Streptomyces narbonensis]|uniref:DUF5047 domain-containing protein n=1 Tax=Streptomyces narbonensis TaxID=67333 RepID=UPI0033DFC9A4
MQTVSAKWAKALTTDHGLSVKVNVLYGGAVIAEDIAFTDGSVKVDRESETRRSLSLSIADPSEFPIAPTDRFAVYGQQIYVESGLTYLDGSSERVPVGTFVITSVTGNIHTGPLTVTGAGLEILLRRALFDTATSTGTGSVAGFMDFHIKDTIPGASFVDSSTNGTNTIPSKTWDANSDKWSALSEAAASIGAELFCDANGTFRLVDVPDPDNVAIPYVWEVAAGHNGVMVSANMGLSAEGVYNRVVASGENAEDNKPPVMAEAKITDTNDPLYYGGPFGKVSKAFSSSLITSTSQAQGAATAMLRNAKASNRTVSLESVPNPALEAGDRIRVVYGDAHLPEIHIVNSFDVPLGISGGFSIATVSGKAED